MIKGCSVRSQHLPFTRLHSILQQRRLWALPNYDGLWSVLIVTEKGDCDRGYRYPIRITRGTLSNGGDTAFTIASKVGPTGLIRVTLSYGDASANGLGQLAGSAGSGSWNSNSCSGTWTAERRGS